MNLKEQWKIEKEKLSHMSWRDKIWYIWEYYKLHMVIALFIILILSAVGTAVYNSTFTTRLYCVILNSPRSHENFDVLTTDFAQAMGYGKKDQVYVESMISSLGNGDSVDAMNDYTTIMKMTTLISASEMDVLICDQNGFDYYAGRMDACYDLTTLLPQDLLDTVSDRLATTVTEDGRTVTAGLDITDTWFAEDVDLTMEPAYLCVIINSERTAEATDLIRYIVSR